jgi:transcriptional regulator with XRE-family HTH domain
MRITAKSLQFVRLSVGFDQSALAKASGLSQGMVSAIERGERSLNSEVELKLRRAIGLSDEMIGKIIDLHWEIQKEVNGWEP